MKNILFTRNIYFFLYKYISCHIFQLQNFVSLINKQTNLCENIIKQQNCIENDAPAEQPN